MRWNMNRFVCLAFLCSLTALAQAQDPARQISAIRQDDLKAVESLLGQGVDPDSRNQEGATALMYAALHAGVPVMKLLLASKADPNAQNHVGATALMWAAGDAGKVRLLVEAGADVNARSRSGRTPLMMAAAYAGNLETVRFLVAKGADPKLVDQNGDGPVGAAASAGDAAILREVLATGGSVAELVRSGGNFRGYTPLMRAAQATCVDCARLLLEHGADPNPVSDSPGHIQAGLQALGNLTPLLIAAPQGNPELIRALLDRRASVDTRDVRGLTPLMLAVTSESQNTEVVQLLLAKGAKADVTAD